MIVCSDAISWLNQHKGATLAITDIPYDVVSRPSAGLRSFDKKDADILTFDVEAFIKHLARLCPTSYVFCATEQVSDIRRYMIDAGLTTRLCIWEKTNPSPVNGQHMWLSGVECCVFGRRKGAVFNEHCANPVWRYPIARKTFHPTEKPVKLMQRLVEASSNAGDLVIDPCAGSGSVGLACNLLGRRFEGCDINNDYVLQANTRLQI